MSGVNIGRVLLGGLLTGLVINLFEWAGNLFFAGAVTEVLAAHNLAAPGTAVMTTGIVIGFAWGIVLVFIYAAIRPRFGAGVSTAVFAALIGWTLATLYAVQLTAMGMFPVGVFVQMSVFSLVEMIVATVAGAALYQEAGAAATTH